MLNAAEAGEISLPPGGERGPAGKLTAGGEFLPAHRIAEFLGENWSQQRVQRCLQVLEEMGDEATETFAVTTPTMAVEIVATAETAARAFGNVS